MSTPIQLLVFVAMILHAGVADSPSRRWKIAETFLEEYESYENPEHARLFLNAVLHQARSAGD